MVDVASLALIGTTSILNPQVNLPIDYHSLGNKLYPLEIVQDETTKQTSVSGDYNLYDILDFGVISSFTKKLVESQHYLSSDFYATIEEDLDFLLS